MQCFPQLDVFSQVPHATIYMFEKYVLMSPTFMAHGNIQNALLTD